MACSGNSIRQILIPVNDRASYRVLLASIPTPTCCRCTYVLREPLAPGARRSLECCQIRNIHHVGITPNCKSDFTSAAAFLLAVGGIAALILAMFLILFGKSGVR